MIKNNKTYYLLILILSFLIFPSCNVDMGEETAGSSDIEKSLAAVKETQKIMLRKLEAIEKNQSALKSGIAGISKPTGKDNKKQQQPQADPNKVYNVAVGDSYVMGNPNAAVTIIEWMDFQ